MVTNFGLARAATIARHLFFERVDQGQKIKIQLRWTDWLEKGIRLLWRSAIQMIGANRQHVSGAQQAG